MSKPKHSPLLKKLRYHVSGAIERGEKEPITAVIAEKCIYCGDAGTRSQYGDLLCDLCIAHESSETCDDPKCPSTNCDGTKLVEDWSESHE